eukprot:754085-Prymnesium_polylepis.1
MAPEVYAHLPYDAKVDVYSFAIVAWEVRVECEPRAPRWRWWGDARPMCISAFTEPAPSRLCPLPLRRPNIPRWRS